MSLQSMGKHSIVHFSGKCSLTVIALFEMYRSLIEAIVYGTIKSSTVNNPVPHLSPRAKTNNFHQIDLDANGVLTHGRK